MRRHAEGLIILSGESPGRGWRNPVPFIDVLRAAVSEVEDYTRIRVTVGTQAALVGPAVADVIHMIAELAENATIYSPPNTPVRVHGDVVGRGFAVEIEDRGLGISEEKLAEINSLLENPPQFDLSGSEQLGLFVAGQLAKRHDIRISLRLTLRRYHGRRADPACAGRPRGRRSTAARPRRCSTDGRCRPRAVTPRGAGSLRGAAATRRPLGARTGRGGGLGPDARPRPGADWPTRRTAGALTTARRISRPPTAARARPSLGGTAFAPARACTGLSGTADEAGLPRRVRQAEPPAPQRPQKPAPPRIGAVAPSRRTTRERARRRRPRFTMRPSSRAGTRPVGLRAPAASGGSASPSAAPERASGTVPAVRGGGSERGSHGQACRDQ